MLHVWGLHITLYRRMSTEMRMTVISRLTSFFQSSEVFLQQQQQQQKSKTSVSLTSEVTDFNWIRMSIVSPRVYGTKFNLIEHRIVIKHKSITYRKIIHKVVLFTINLCETKHVQTNCIKRA
jgi:ethanolamine utilization protein EutQ (cupin superfamily)